MNFINRKQELDFLNDKWMSGKAELLVLWGKRRVGKTELVKQFIQGKPYIYFMGESTSRQDQLRQISDFFADFFKEPLLATRGFAAWSELFMYLQQKKERLILVIDEFPYLMDAERGLASVFQKGWDENLRHSSVFLILLGSSIGMMETEVLGQHSPLYGRRTGQWRVEPLVFQQARLFRSNAGFVDQISHFSVAGGMPAYWLQFEDEKDIWKNIRDHVLAKGQYLYDEAEFILREELREPRHYFAILTAISQGKRRLAEIVNATGFASTLINKYLGILGDLHIVERELPVTEDKPHKSKKGLYRIQDPFLQFWFRFVFPRRSLLEMGQVDRVIAGIHNEWPVYMGGIYELVAAELLRDMGATSFPFSRIGRWWNRAEEIDVVAVNENENSILFAEVKFSNRPVGLNIYDDLLRKAHLVTWGHSGRREYFALFSAAGFTPAMVARARQNGVGLWEGEKRIF